jgi:hypothetical protein
MLSLKEASTYLGMDERALASLASERRIPSLQLDGAWIFSKKSIVSASTPVPSKPRCAPTPAVTARTRTRGA